MSKIADFSFVAASLDKMSHNVSGLGDGGQNEAETFN